MNILIRTMAILAFSAVTAYGMMDTSITDLDLNLKTNSVSTTRIVLTWEAPELGIHHFDLDRSDDGFDYSSLAQLDSNLRFYSDVTVTRGECVFYRLRACFDAACSESSPYSNYYDTAEPVSIAEGSTHSVALKSDGTVWARGENDKGQLGDGTFLSHEDVDYVREADGTPLQNIIAIAAGHKHSLALGADGTVWAWGNNADVTVGPLLYNAYETLEAQILNIAPSCFAVKVGDISGTPLQNIIAISTKYEHSLALTEDGRVWRWGNDFMGGTGLAKQVNDPASGNLYLEDVVAISTGLLHSIALKADGTVWGWGLSYQGQLGTGYSNSFEYFPTQMKKESNGDSLENIIEIAAGGLFTLALDTNGQVWATGQNTYGQLGNGTTETSLTAFQVLKEDGTPLDNIRDLAAGYNHSLAETKEATIMIWGNNDCGQLGDGQESGLMSLYPIPVMKGPGEEVGDDVAVVVANANRSFALLYDGTFFVWGSNLNSGLETVPTGNESLYPEDVDFNLFVLEHDINIDGQVNLTDVLKIVYYVIGLAPLTGIEKLYADVNGDGIVTIGDAISLIHTILKA